MMFVLLCFLLAKSCNGRARNLCALLLRTSFFFDTQRSFSIPLSLLCSAAVSLCALLFIVFDKDYCDNLITICPGFVSCLLVTRLLHRTRESQSSTIQLR